MSLTSAASSAGESAGSVTVTAAVTTATGGALACPVTVAYATADRAAAAGSDYTAASGTLVFPTGTPSGSTQAIPVTLLHDTLDEADEPFAVRLTGANGAMLGATPTQTVTILDDDPAPTMAIGDVTVSEGAGPATFTVTLSTTNATV